MSKKLLLTLFTFSVLLSTTFAQSWLWAKQGKNHTTQNDGHAIAMDNFHNAYLTGSFSNDTLILGTDTLLIKGPTRQAFLQKYDENGNLLWATSSESTTRSGNGSSPLGTYANSVTTDFKNNVYITGNFYDTVYFQSFILENQYNPLVFIAKYDENGNVKWVKQCTRGGGRGNVNDGEGVVCDKSGNVYITGYFTDTVNFGPYTLRTPYSAGTFLIKYDSSGNVLWAKQSINGKGINNSNGILGGNPIAIDELGHIYISGYFADTVYFGAQILTSKVEDAFIVKYDSNGNVIWARQSTTTSSKSSANAYGICTDKNANIYITGNFFDTLHFGATTLIGPYLKSNIYWAKFDSNGNVLWAKQSYDIDSNFWFTWGIEADASENLYLTGFRDAVHYSNAKAVFNSDTIKQNKAGSPFLFIKMDSLGTVLIGYLFQSIPGSGGEEPLAVDSSGCYVYYGGDADTSVVFGNDTVGTSVNPKPSRVNYPFIARWSDGACAITTGNKTIENPNLTVNLYPNPNNGIFTVAVSHAELVSASQTTIDVYNMFGEKIFSETLGSAQGDNLINLKNESSGVYLYRITDQQSNLISSGKFIIQ